jgi:hypothetical protein
MGGKSNTGLLCPNGQTVESSMTMERFAGLELRLDTPKGTTFPLLCCYFPFLGPSCFTLCCTPSRGTQYAFCLPQHKHRITPGTLQPLAYNLSKVYYFSSANTGWDVNDNING